MLRPLALALSVHIALEIPVDTLFADLVEAELFLVVAVGEVVAVARGEDCGQLSGTCRMSVRECGTLEGQRVVGRAGAAVGPLVQSHGRF